ncbi:MAG TPA: hypothetical protein VG454_01675 [Gemmatimonadales bacterium]|nr:hypothetical protein [Gemmatimonadales bacterium]
MLDYAEAEDEIILARREREMPHVGLKHPMPVVLWKILLICLDGATQIDRRDTGARGEQDLGETSGAAASLEHLCARMRVQESPGTRPETPPGTTPRDVGATVGIELRLAEDLPLQAKRVRVVLSIGEHARDAVVDRPLVPARADKFCAAREQRLPLDGTNDLRKRGHGPRRVACALRSRHELCRSRSKQASRERGLFPNRDE